MGEISRKLKRKLGEKKESDLSSWAGFLLGEIGIILRGLFDRHWEIIISKIGLNLGKIGLEKGFSILSFKCILVHIRRIIRGKFNAKSYL